eukprot:12189364-Heterocapsa_arctica.AAC.1
MAGDPTAASSASTRPLSRPPTPVLQGKGTDKGKGRGKGKDRSRSATTSKPLQPPPKPMPKTGMPAISKAAPLMAKSPSKPKAGSPARPP